METAALSNVCLDPEHVGHLPVRRQEGEAPEVPPAFREIKGILNEIDKQILIVSRAAAASFDTPAYSGVTVSETAPLSAPQIAVPSPNEHWVSRELRTERGLWFVLLTGSLLATLGLGWFGGSNLYRLFDRRDDLTGRAAINAVVERVISVESNGDPNAKNRRSSATGLGQFLNETWLDMIRADRPDLIRTRGENEILELRRDAKLVREITTRFAERNAMALRRRGLPVTVGTVYLSHFAGGAGAVAILSAPENADAALVLASADATGRTTRDNIIKANPFLEHFTVTDLKNWADRKMRGPDLSLTDVLAAAKQ
jgi:hypothetical protein